MNKAPQRWSDLPMDWWQSELAAKELVQHFERYTLGLLLAAPSGDTYEAQVFSGLKVRHQGMVLWVTAGHVIDLLDEARRDHGHRISNMAWLDPTGSVDSGAFTVHNRNFPLYSATKDDLDIGFAVLDWLDSKLTTENEHGRLLEGFTPGENGQFEVEGLFVVGRPSEAVEYSRSQYNETKVLNTVTTKQMALPLEIVASEDEGSQLSRSSDSILRCRLLPFSDSEADQPSSIVGMSGGPVFAVGRRGDEGLAISIVGIQSSWSNESRVTRAVRFAPALEWIYQKVASMEVGS